MTISTKFVKKDDFLIDWLQGRGLYGDYFWIYECCFEGKVKIVEDKSYSKDSVVWRCTNRKCNKKKYQSEKDRDFQEAISYWNN